MLIAINRHLIDKPSDSEIKQHHRRFENVDIDAADLAAHIKRGHAFCPQHAQGQRRAAGFIGAGYLAVDIDYGLTLEAVKGDEYFQRYATILYTTASHSKDNHRFRIVFELEQPIMDAIKMEQALTGLIGRFGGDRSCKDACRMFYGSSNSSPLVMACKLPVAEVEALVTRGQEREFDSDTTGEDNLRNKSAVRSRINIPRDTMVRTETGVVALLKDVPSETRIHCPQHLDTRPSARTFRNTRGNPGLYCSTCNASFFLDDGLDWSSQHEYRFDYHWRSVLDVSYEEYETHAGDDSIVDLSELRGGRIRVLNKRFLSYDEFALSVSNQTDESRLRLEANAIDVPVLPRGALVPDKDITFVKSPKGSGKTEWLKQLVTAHRAHDRPILMIGHRRALITATSERIGLTSYLGGGQDGEEEDADAPRAFAAAPNNRYAVCVDSLPRMDTKAHRYDVVLIDEVEQVLSHLLSSTLRDSRREALHALRHYVNNAKVIYLLDADLNQVTIELLSVMLDERDRSYQAIVNLWQPPAGRTVELFGSPNPDHLIGELLAALKRKERCFVCSNSKALIDTLKLEVRKTLGETVRSIAITSDNSQTRATQAFLRDVRNRALDYDLILTSPAVGTGIDITFDDDAQHIDSVFGFFRARINTHFDIDQQLSRVRNPKRVAVWISPEEFRFETDAEVIKAELRASDAEHRLIRCIEPDGTKLYHEDPLYDTVFSVITASQRASKNRLRHNFMELRQSNGWSVVIVDHDTDMSAIGRDARKSGSEERRRIEFEQIVQALPVSEDEYDRLRKAERADRASEAERLSCKRFDVERFYLREVDVQLLEEDNEGKLRAAVRAFEDLTAPDDVLETRDHHADKQVVFDRPQYLLKKKLMVGLLQRAGLMRGGAFDADAQVEAGELGEFVIECRRSREKLARLFGVDVRGDLATKPVSQLQEVLKLFGLKLDSKRNQSGGKSRYVYWLNAEKLAHIRQWVERRSDSANRSAWKAILAARAQVDVGGDGKSPDAFYDPAEVRISSKEPVSDPLDRR